MLKTLCLVLAFVGVVLSTHGDTPGRFATTIYYNGQGCTGNPIRIASSVSGCTPNTVATCYPDTAPWDSLSFQALCMPTIKESLQKLPESYVAEVVYRTDTSTNCSMGPQAIAAIHVYGMNMCTPSDGDANKLWRFYDTCNPGNFSSKRECVAGCGSCASRVDRSGFCYDLPGNDGKFRATHYCNTIPDEIMGYSTSPAAKTYPYAVLSVVIAVLTFFY